MTQWTLVFLAAVMVGTPGPAAAQAMTADGGRGAPRFLVNDDIVNVSKSRAPAHLEGHLETVVSDWEIQSETAREMQKTDAKNPGITAAARAKPLWDTAEGRAEKACADCHGSVEDMAGVVAEFPKWNNGLQSVVTLQMQVNDCRVARMKADPWPADATQALEMEALLTRLSRGVPVNVAIDGPARSAWEVGRALYYTPMGPDQKSCATCHEAAAQRDKAAAIEPVEPMAPQPGQGQINGFPAYRLSRAALEGVATRFQLCAQRLDPTSPALDAKALAALELYVASRGNGLSVEGPSVRD